ncbi:MAG: hypothetical protein NTV30_07340 [Chloroflexi bacterium]|nr:hypothetical protein [Chloroflexota bacterium]
MALSIFFDELWARQENKKTFNWLSLFDEIPIGLFCAIGISYVNTLGINNNTFVFPWELTLIIVGSGVVLAVVIEFLRPFRMHPSHAFPENDSDIETQIRTELKSNNNFVYWDSQNPFWIQLLSIIMPLVFIIIAIIMWFSIIWMAILYLIIGLALTVFYGGLRTMVTRDIVLVKVGFLGIRLLKLKSSDIIQAETVKFSPLHDFGGYGFRINSEMKAYFFKGNTGTKITTSSGKKYLIGSDNAQRLTVIINSMKNT